uniref:FtsK domain-containing protein n=1 Tax=uncultured Bacillota bacterium TaxID=344338 RepID=A0A650EMT1_9FIRM|nr:hypothetical protein Firmicute1046_1550 [uncultured Firmicutes bacterium]
MKQKILHFINTYKKYWITLATYLIMILILWCMRNNLLYSHIPSLILDMHYTHTILDIMILTVVFTGLICLVQLLRCPPRIRQKFNKVCRRHDIKNKTDEFPELRTVKPYQRHKYIYNVKNKDITCTMFMNNAEALEQALDVRISDMRLCKRGKTTDIFVTPKKYYKPAEITLDDENLGSNITIDNLINAIICGNTGSGKTVLMKAIIAKIGEHQPSATFHILDFKNYDFQEFSDSPLYYSYKDCVEGMNNFYRFFKKQQERGIASPTPQYLVIDEWASFVTSLDKKTREDMISKLAELIQISRAFNYHILVGVQRADSTYFGSARFNFKCRFGMGNLDAEGKRMLFDGYTELMNEQNDTGEGYLLIEGKGIERIKVVVKDFDKLDKMVRKAK